MPWRAVSSRLSESASDEAGAISTDSRGGPGRPRAVGRRGARATVVPEGIGGLSCASHGYAKGPIPALPVSASWIGMLPPDSRGRERFGRPGSGSFVPGPAGSEPRRHGGAGGTRPQKKHGTVARPYAQTTNNGLTSRVGDGCRVRTMLGWATFRIFAAARRLQGGPAGCSGNRAFGNVIPRCRPLIANPATWTACADQGETDVAATGIVARRVPGWRQWRAGVSVRWTKGRPWRTIGSLRLRKLPRCCK